MARPLFDLFTIVLSLLVVVVVNRPPYDVVSAVDSLPATAMILPLYLSPPKDTSSAHVAFRRRYLRSRARMSLHDDLELKGYYTTRLWIGTPAQLFSVIVDTGSTVTFVPCASCEHCGTHQDPRFEPNKSTTYHPLKCNVECSCDNKKEYCIYEKMYAEISSSSGVLGEDIVSFGNHTQLSPQRAIFGCENVETGAIYYQHADGIMGLGRGDMSIVDQLVQKTVISDSFSLCYGGMDVSGGAMVLGALSPPTHMLFSPSDPTRSPFYNVELKEIHVDGKALPLDPQVFDANYGTVLDSGTTYAYLPKPAFLTFKDAMMKQLHSLTQIQGPDPNYADICFSGAGNNVVQLSKTFPAVDMVFSNGEKLSLSPENYLFRHSKVHGAYCLGIFQNGNDATTLLGGIIVRNTLVTYDREHEKIGFWKTNCSELWHTLHTQATSSPSMSPQLEKMNSTYDISLAIGPSRPPESNASNRLTENLILMALCSVLFSYIYFF